jgi:hypothetical protein
VDVVMTETDADVIPATQVYLTLAEAPAAASCGSLSFWNAAATASTPTATAAGLSSFCCFCATVDAVITAADADSFRHRPFLKGRGLTPLPFLLFSSDTFQIHLIKSIPLFYRLKRIPVILVFLISLGFLRPLLFLLHDLLLLSDTKLYDNLLYDSRDKRSKSRCVCTKRLLNFDPHIFEIPIIECRKKRFFHGTGISIPDCPGSDGRG